MPKSGLRCAIWRSAWENSPKAHCSGRSAGTGHRYIAPFWSPFSLPPWAALEVAASIVLPGHGVDPPPAGPAEPDPVMVTAPGNNGEKKAPFSLWPPACLPAARPRPSQTVSPPPALPRRPALPYLEPSGPPFVWAPLYKVGKFRNALYRPSGDRPLRNLPGVAVHPERTGGLRESRARYSTRSPPPPGRPPGARCHTGYHRRRGATPPPCPPWRHSISPRRFPPRRSGNGLCQKASATLWGMPPV